MCTQQKFCSAKTVDALEQFGSVCQKYQLYDGCSRFLGADQRRSIQSTWVDACGQCHVINDARTSDEGSGEQSNLMVNCLLPFDVCSSHYPCNFS